jgi:hypothetical protein
MSLILPLCVGGGWSGSKIGRSLSRGRERPELGRSDCRAGNQSSPGVVIKPLANPGPLQRATPTQLLMPISALHVRAYPALHWKL